jgi:Icc-related predicted phosphoesterase
MRLVIVSDTHGRHDDLGVLEGDVLIHCGDSGNGFQRDPRDADRLDDWFARQKFDAILCIGGNHDFALEQRSVAGSEVLQNAVFLKDGCFEHDGVLFYGSPWTPELVGWAFYLEPERAESTWSKIPLETDVLITHSPPAGILDANRRGRECGCPHLAKRVEIVRPAVHCFGHVHASAGRLHRDGTVYVNASMVNSQYEIAHSPVVYELRPGRA